MKFLSMVGKVNKSSRCGKGNSSAPRLRPAKSNYTLISSSGLRDIRRYQNFYDSQTNNSDKDKGPGRFPVTCNLSETIENSFPTLHQLQLWTKAQMTKSQVQLVRAHEFDPCTMACTGEVSKGKTEHGGSGSKAFSGCMLLRAQRLTGITVK